MRDSSRWRAGAIDDISARKAAEENRRKLEEQLRQAQKSRGQTATRQPIDLGNTVAEASGLLRSSLPASIEIRTRLAPANPRVAADPTAVHQVVMNLATNAAHAMPGGGRLDIQVEPIYVRDSTARFHPDLHEGTYVQLVVSDTGQGIDPEVLNRVFEPFFTTKPPGQGSGLGLSMVHGIMRDHEGAVILTSERGTGTQVRCYFPALETEPAAAPAEEIETPPGSGQRILLVDDEPSLASVGRRRLAGLGYEVTVSTDPIKALEEVRARPDAFDLVLTDYSMPKLNGLDLARGINRIRADLPIVLSTGFAEEFPEETLAAAGIRRVLSKPVGISDLARALQALLSPK
ncbi:MAG: ATP-binding protein [Gemmatimonadales bacterium]